MSYIKYGRTTNNPFALWVSLANEIKWEQKKATKLQIFNILIFSSNSVIVINVYFVVYFIVEFLKSSGIPLGYTALYKCKLLLSNNNHQPFKLYNSYLIKLNQIKSLIKNDYIESKLKILFPSSKPPNSFHWVCNCPATPGVWSCSTEIS